MSVRGRHFSISSFTCVKCGREGIPIGRRNSHQRGQSHLKKLYCIHCKEETNHIETRDFDFNIDLEEE